MDKAHLGDRRRIRGRWLYALYPSLTAALALALMPVNANFGDRVNFDPQGDDQVFDHLYGTAVMRHTSGFAFGLLIALLLGATLAVERRLTFAWTLAAAALGGVVLAAVNVCVAWFAGGTKRISITPAQNGTIDYGFDVDLLYDDGFRQAILGGAAGFPIWAVAGVGLGALLSNMTNARIKDVASFVAALLLLSICGGYLLVLGEGAPGTLVAILLWPPFGGNGFITKVAMHDHPTAATAAFLSGSLCYAAALCILGRPRFRSRAA